MSANVSGVHSEVGGGAGIISQIKLTHAAAKFKVYSHDLNCVSSCLVGVFLAS